MRQNRSRCKQFHFINFRRHHSTFFIGTEVAENRRHLKVLVMAPPLDRKGHDRREQDRTGQERSGQDRTGQKNDRIALF